MAEKTAAVEFKIAWERALALTGIDFQPLDDVCFDRIDDEVEMIETKEISKGEDDCDMMQVDEEDTASKKDEANCDEEEPDMPPVSAPTQVFFLQPVIVSNVEKEDCLVTDPMDVDDVDQCNENVSIASSNDSDDSWEVAKTKPTIKNGVDIEYLVSILEKGKEATGSINQESDVVLVLGGTGVGKSTFLQAIAADQKLTRTFDTSLRKSPYVVEGDEVEGFEIGHGLESKTRHVRAYLREATSTYYVDSSGFGDTQGIETDIATSMCVQEIAQRAGKLRFVVLVNAFQFFSDRATELRRNLDVVAKFIGHNFRDHKFSFTFLFTHCNEAFSDVRSLIEDSVDAETILSAMRANIVKLLSETRKSTFDVPTQELIKFLGKSLKKKDPFCDVFDPVFSDPQMIRSNVRPSSAKSCLEEPSKIVSCSLVPTAKLRLDQELQRRKTAIALKLRNGELDGGIWEDMVCVRSLCSQIPSLGKGMMNELTRDVQNRLSQLKDDVFEIIHTHIPLKGGDDDVRFTVEVVKTVQQSIEWIGFITSLLEECETQGPRYAPTETDSKERKGQELSRLIGLLNEEAKIMENEMDKMPGYLCDESESPDLRDVSKKLVKFRIWASVFEGELAAILLRTLNQKFKTP
jgi:hypothetical protein